MIKILNSGNETQAILQNVLSPIISEDINREKTFDFTTVIDNDKSNYVNYQHKLEVEDNYFNIVYTEEERTQEGLFINAQCEHVSYDLISANLTSGFTATGLFSEVATTLLSGTDFTVGTVEITASETISVNESTNKRQVLMQLASLYDGELKFDKYAISLLTRRGSDSGVQFRYRKNLTGVKRIVDNRKKVGGLPTISYSINVAELEFEQSYMDKGYASLEHFELGDTVKVIDEDLNLEVSLRIVKESHDPLQRMQGTVEISNFVDDLADTLTQIQTTSVAKNSIYNGVSIGPDDGFVAERSDQLVKTTTNATEGISIDLRQTITASYTPVFYVQTDTATGTAKLYLAGNAVFTGEIVGGSILIGSGSNTFNANGTDGIWLGATEFATAPFSVSLSGILTASEADITGVIHATSGSFAGTISASGTIQGGAIAGATITGGLIRTASSGERIEMADDGLNTYNASNQLNGLVTESEAGTHFGDVYLYDKGNESVEFYNMTGYGYAIRSSPGYVLYLGGQFRTTVPQGTWDFGEAYFEAILGLETGPYSSSNHNHGIPNGTVLQTVTGTATFVESGSFSHNHTVKKA